MMKNKFFWFVLVFPLLFSCQKPYDEKEKGIRDLPASMEVLVLDSLWQKRDSLSYLRLKNIDKLLLKDNDSLPNWISNFSNLNSIDIACSNKNFVNIPKSIGKLKKLEIFDASENNIKELPSEIYDAKALKVLDLDNNLISEISKNIFNLSNLESLSLRSNNISFLPESICQLTKLETLIIENNRLSQLPKCLGTLPNIDWINVSGTQLKEFPLEILNAPKLKTIHAKGLKLTNYQEVKEICEKRNITFYYDEK